MPLVYRRVDLLLSSNAGGEVREGDCLLIDPGRRPEEGALTLVRKGSLEMLCRWHDGRAGDVLGLVIGVKRRL